MSIVYFLNVGRGDCSIIGHDSGRLTMIDINRVISNTYEKLKNESRIMTERSLFSLKSFNILSNKNLSLGLGATNPKGNFNKAQHPTDPIKFLQENYFGEKIWRFILTHPDMDHLKGLKNLSDEIGFINFWSYHNSKDSTNFKEEDKEDWNFYQNILNKKEQNICFLKLINTNNYQYLPSDELTILSPSDELINRANTKKNWNDASATILYKTNGVKFLFCGDGGDETWEHLLNSYINEVSNIDVFFAPHHERISNRNFKFLDIVKPKITILGNAESDCLAYEQYENKSKYLFTNNQAGDFKFEIKDNKLGVYFSNKNFTESFCEKNHIFYKSNCEETWYFIGI